MTKALDGKVVLVTGAGGGIGRDIALMAATEGAAVVVNDLGASLKGTGQTETAAQKVVEEIRAAGGDAIADGGSVTDPDAARAMIEAGVKEFGRIDAVVNNAGILRDGKMLLTSTDNGSGMNPRVTPVMWHSPLAKRVRQGTSAGWQVPPHAAG